MLPLQANQIKRIQLGGAQPGDLFLHKLGSPAVPCIAVQPDGNELIALRLDTFELWSPGKGRDLNVFALGISAKELQLRVDLASAVSSYTDHFPGQLLLGDDGPCISVVWQDLVGKGYRNVVMLDGWGQSMEDMPRFIFERWSLSFFDGKDWINLVNAPEPVRPEPHE